MGTNTLEGEPTLNHVHGGSNPTFTVQVENSGEATETNVKVDVTVTAGGKQFKASHIRAVPMTKDKRPSEVFAAIARWIDAKMVKRKERGLYERILQSQARKPKKLG